MQTAFSGTKIAGFWKLLIVVSCLWTNGDVIRHTGALSRFGVFFKMGENNLSTLERFLYDLEMITHEQNRNNKRTEIERFDWSICHFDVILQHDWPIQQCLLQWYRVFFGGKTKSPCFDLYIYWLIKQITNTCRNHFSRSYENRSKYGYILFGKRSENIRTTERSKADLSVGNIYIWLIKRHGFRVLQMTGKIYVFTNIRTSVNEASMRERRETLSFLSFLARRERPLLAGKSNLNIKLLNSGIPSGICWTSSSRPFLWAHTSLVTLSCRVSAKEEMSQLT